MSHPTDDIVSVHVTNLKDTPVQEAQYQRVHALAFRSMTTDLLMWQGTLEVPLMGWSVVEPTGAAPATFDIYDGLDATGTLLASISLTSGQSTRDYLGPWGIMLRTGLFVDVLTGAIKGAMWIGKPL